MYPHLAQWAASQLADPYPPSTLDYSVCRSWRDLLTYLNSTPEHHFTPRPLIAADTESLPTGVPFCTTISHTPGTGRLIYLPGSGKSDSDTITYYADYLAAIPGITSSPHVLYHNYLHDNPIYESLSFNVDRFTDTMVRAYNLCLGGGGDEEDGGSSRAGRGFLSLKILAWRQCQMRMNTFQETVYPYAVPHLLEWLDLAALLFTPDSPAVACVCGHKRANHNPRGKTGKVMGSCKECGTCERYKRGKAVKNEDDKPLSLLHRKLKKLCKDVREDLRAGHADSDVEETTDNPRDPWKRIKAWHDWDRETLVKVIGSWPLPSVEYLPEDVLLNYAVRDADATLRLYLKMRKMKPWLFYQRKIA